MLTNEHIHKGSDNLFEFYCFASDVAEFHNGFPRTVKTNIGNGQPLVGRTKKVDSEGDIVYVRYTQQLGCLDLIVYND